MELIITTEKRYIREALKIRYDVYCIEKNYEKISDKDKYDSKATHLLIRHNNKFIACCRLIFPNLLDLENSFLIQKLATIDNIIDAMEISRFCVLKEYRNQKEVTSKLIEGIKKMSDKNNIKFWYATMEPSFIRYLRYFNIRFTNIGSKLFYKGRMRQPCVFSTKE